MVNAPSVSAFMGRLPGTNLRKFYAHW